MLSVNVPPIELLVAVDAHDDVDDVDNLAAFLWCDDDDDFLSFLVVAPDGGGVATTTRPVQPWWKFLGKLVLRNLNGSNGYSVSAKEFFV